MKHFRKYTLLLGLAGQVFLPGNAAGQSTLALRQDDANAAIAKHDFGRAETIYRQLAAAEPNNLDYSTALARLKAWRGDWTGASAAYDEVLRRDPMHYDALVGKAQVCVYQGHLQEAEESLRRAESITGPNTELHLAWARLYRAEGKSHREQFEEHALESLKLEPDNKEGQSLLQQARDMRGIRPFEVRLSYGRDQLSQAPPGQMEGVTAGWRGELNAVHVVYERWRRFGEQSNRAGLDYSVQFAGKWRLRGTSLLGDSKGGFLPKHDHTIGVFRPLNSRTAAGLDYRYLSFPNVKVSVLAPTSEFYFTPKTSLQGTLFVSRLQHQLAVDHTSVHVSGLTMLRVQLHRRLQVTAGYAKGSQGYFAYTSDRLLSFNTNTFIGGTEIRLTPTIILGASFASEFRSNNTRQQGMGMYLMFR